MDLQPIKLDTHKEKTKKKLSPLQNSMEIETRIENNRTKNKERTNLVQYLLSNAFQKPKRTKESLALFHPQMGPKNKTSFIQKRATNNLQLFTIGKHTQNSSVFPLTNKTTKSTKPTMTTQHKPRLLIWSKLTDSLESRKQKTETHAPKTS